MGGQSTDRDKSALVSAISGIFGSSAGKAFSHPIDTIKARLQVLPGSNLTRGEGSIILNTAREVLKIDGIPGLYKGLPTALIGGIPAAFLYFGSYEFWKSHTLKVEFLKKHNFISYLSAGMFAETVAWLIFVPTDVLKERLQVQSKLQQYKYTSDFDALMQVIRNEGLRGLYKAYPATVFSFGPFSAFYFLFYEKLKGLIVENDPETYLKKVKEKTHVSIGFFQSMFVSMIAGAAASFLTNPLDMVKLRLQVQRGVHSVNPNAPDIFKYKHMVDGLIQIVSKEGVLALYNGSFARMCYHFPTVAIAMSVVEFMKPHVEKIINK